MKLGVMTFHQALNYGALLQTYALQRYVRTHIPGGDMEVVDYRCPALTALYSTAAQKSGNPVKTVIKTGHFLLKRRCFQGFLKEHIRRSPVAYTPDTIARSVERYDKFIAGSDQVWNPSLTDGDWNYLLAFAPPRKRYAYAASVGKARFPAEMEETFCHLLGEFQAISVREESAAGMLGDLGLTAQVHIDPVLLLERQEWEALCASVAPRRKGYVLVFGVAKSQALVQQAAAYARERGLEVLYIGQHLGNCPARYIPFLKIQKLLALFRDCEAVFTNSFHGTVLSILFHRPFWAMAQHTDGRASRITDLLEKLHLSSRTHQKQLEAPVDWEMVDGVLETLRRQAGEYLEWMVRDEN